MSILGIHNQSAGQISALPDFKFYVLATTHRQVDVKKYFFFRFFFEKSFLGMSSPKLAETTTDLPSSSTDEIAVQTGYHSSGLISSTLNLIKNIIATSMLTMPYGTSLSGVFPSVVMCVIVGTLSAFTFGLLGLLCGESKVVTYRQLCEKYLGKKIGNFVDLMLASYTLPCCIGYVCFVCDCMRVMLVELTDAPNAFYTSRTFIGIILSVTILLPLCSTDKIHSLTWTSIIGLGAIIYCYIFVAVDLGQQSNSDDLWHLVSSNLWWPPSGSPISLFPIANIYAAAFLVQYNSPKFFYELSNPTKKRFMTVSFSAVAFVVVFCTTFAVMGFARFGFATQGNLLKGYSRAYAAWVATSVSLITTYPFDFDGGRRSVISIVKQQWPHVGDKKIFWISTLAMIPIFTTISVLVDDLSIVIGINGAVFGITTGFTIPGLLLWKKANQDNEKKRKIVGACISGFGVSMSILGLVSIIINYTQ